MSNKKYNDVDKMRFKLTSNKQTRWLELKKNFIFCKCENFTFNVTSKFVSTLIKFFNFLKE